jgi:hypothetical protein
MTPTSHTTEHDENAPPSRGPAEPKRPDQVRPRGNQDVEKIDVERGQEKIERVLGW